MITFWILAPVIVLAALGVVLARKAVHSALLLAVVMISLAITYAAQGAPFLFAVQIIVYTGAIMMLFLFVLMLVGVDASDSLVETIRGQRLAATTVGLAFGVLVVIVVGQTAVGVDAGLGEANANGNVYGLAALMFTTYVLAIEFSAALLITAAVGAMVLAHRERLVPRRTQREEAQRRLAEYAESGRHPGPLPTPGVYARHNAVDTPALLPDGTPSELSISRILRARGSIREGFAGDVGQTLRQLDPNSETHTIGGSMPRGATVPADDGADADAGSDEAGERR